MVHFNNFKCVSVCAAACGAFFLYISSDYVFDGRNPPYGEDDAPNPLNVYGRSKLEGERETLRHCPGNCLFLTFLSFPSRLSCAYHRLSVSGAVVLRVPILFGEVETVSESAVTCLWLRVQEATEGSTLDHCQQRFPTDTRDVAAVCRKLSERARQVLGCGRRSASTSPVSPTTPLSLTCFITSSDRFSVYHAGPIYQRNLSLFS